jgi:predicted peptidase
MVIAPQLPVRGDLWYAYAEEVRFLVQDTQNRHNGDRARSYLTGFSFGGNGVFDLAIRQPGFWAALWAVDPTRIPGQDPERPLCLAFGTLARARKEAFIRALHLNPYNKNPGSDRIHLDEGEDHVGAARRAYGDDRLYDWLLSKQLT